jgi:general secretion pathway protein D
VHVVYLKNAEATKLAETLRAVVSGEGGGNASQSGSGSLSSLGSNSGNTQMGQSSIGSTSQSGSSQTGPTNPALSSSARSGSQQALGGGQAGFIQADATTNTLIITAPEAVYRNLRAVIDQLDVRRAQVYIESMIVEVNAAKLSEFGVQWAGLQSSGHTYRVGGGTTFNNVGGANSLVNLNAFANEVDGSSPPGSGLTLGIFKQLANGKLGLGAVAHALGADDDSNILSTPNMLTLDNEVATIKVGQNVPIVTGSFTTTSGTNNNPFQTVDRKDIGITLKVRPQISEGGTIKLAIYNESSSIDTSVTTSSGLVLKNRTIETNIVADDGQILVLGGLIQDDSSDGVEKVPGLGDLPLIGNLFKYQKRNRKKTNLMVFLRPVVVRNREQGMSLTADRYDYMRATQEAAAPEPSITVQNLGAPLLPQLQNGQPRHPCLNRSSNSNEQPPALRLRARLPGAGPAQRRSRARGRCDDVVRHARFRHRGSVAPLRPHQPQAPVARRPGSGDRHRLRQRQWRRVPGGGRIRRRPGLDQAAAGRAGHRRLAGIVRRRASDPHDQRAADASPARRRLRHPH